MTLKQGQAILDKLAGKNQLILEKSLDGTYYKIMYGGGRGDDGFIWDSAEHDSYDIDSIIGWAQTIVEEYLHFASVKDPIKKVFKTINEAIGEGFTPGDCSLEENYFDSIEYLGSLDD